MKTVRCIVLQSSTKDWDFRLHSHRLWHCRHCLSGGGGGEGRESGQPGMGAYSLKKVWKNEVLSTCCHLYWVFLERVPQSQGGRSCMILQHFCTHSLHHHLCYFNYYHIFNVVFYQIELFGDISYKGYPFKSCNILFVAMIAINL